MVCRSIALQSYRNIKLERCELSDGVNVLWGQNAQGKSNLLEAIYIFARGRSFRSAKDKELISFGEKYLQLSLDFKKESDAFPINLEMTIPAEGRKTISKNSAPMSGIKELIGQFRAVLFYPGNLTLVGGSPHIRRSFMDIALSQLYPMYLVDLARYNKILLQRNTLIKNAKSQKIDANIWDVYATQLADLGSKITRRRIEYMTTLEDVVKNIFMDMTDGKEVPTLRYRTTVFNEDGNEALKSQLTDNIEKEIIVGSTLYGPHKDDIAIKLNEKEARSFASQGQQRSLALSMKLAEGEISHKITGEYPVFLLDDVMSELDENRRAFLLSSLKGRQIIITSCEPDVFPLGTHPDRLLQIEEGKIIKNESYNNPIITE